MSGWGTSSFERTNVYAIPLEDVNILGEGVGRGWGLAGAFCGVVQLKSYGFTLLLSRGTVETYFCI